MSVCLLLHILYMLGSGWQSYSAVTEVGGMTEFHLEDPPGGLPELSDMSKCSFGYGISPCRDIHHLQSHLGIEVTACLPSLALGSEPRLGYYTWRKCEGNTVHLAGACNTAAWMLLFVHLYALVAGVHMSQEVLGRVKLPRDALNACAKWADPVACSQVARVLHQA